jgi:hypothetical protein
VPLAPLEDFLPPFGPLERDLDDVVDDDIEGDGELCCFVACLAGDFDAVGTLVCDAESTVLEIVDVDVGCNMSEPIQVRSV